MATPAGGTFIPNPLGILAATRNPLFLGALEAIAKEIAAVARSIAPEDPADAGGHYRDMIGTNVEVWPPGEGMGIATVLATKWTSGWIEFGTGGGERTPRFAVLRRAADAFGGVSAARGIIG